jgi:hypothetical protein
MNDIKEPCTESVNIPAEETITSYKGFDNDFRCRDFQFEIGETYTIGGEIKACERGFHACEYPLNVFEYYPPVNSRFAIVNQSGKMSKHGTDTKIASGRITIEAEIHISEMVEKAVAWIMSKLDPAKVETNTGNRSAATNTGEWSAATNTGEWSAATNTGEWSAATNTGNRSAATNTGNRSAATNTGCQSAATNTGNQSAATNTGNRSAATNTGEWSAATNTGNRSAATNTGCQSAASVSGVGAVAMTIGMESKSKAADGGAIVCVYCDTNWNLVHIRAAKVGGPEGIMPDVWYTLDAEGNFSEVAE